MDDLLPYATDRQKELIAAVKQHGSLRKAATSLHIHERTLTRSLAGLRRRAAAQGHGTPATVPPGYAVSGTSTLYDDEGNTRLTWVKTHKARQAAQDAILEALEAFQCPSLPTLKKPTSGISGLLTAYHITDYHIGAYAWSDETGDDWDTDIAVKTLLTAMQDLMAGSPDSMEAILAIMGDFLHWDGLESVTPTSHNILDADTRFPRLVDISIDLLIKVIALLLQKHRQVRVILCEGNHDLASSVWLQKLMKHLFRGNRRVTVDDTAFPYYAHLHGQTLLCWHHGHKVKNDNLPLLFATEPRYREAFGQAKHTYIHTGHYHHHESKEHSGIVVERHPTLAGRDAYAARGGWVSQRAANAITYDMERGEVSRVTVRP